MVDVGNGRIYEVLNLRDLDDSPSKLKLAKSSSNNLPLGYSTYSVPRGVNGTPPRTCYITPAVPPRNRHMSDGDIASSLGNSPNDKGGLVARQRAPSGLTKSPSIGSIGKELALSEFINKYAKSLPQRVRVCKGFYGVSDQTAVTTGDILNMHYLKTTKVVVIETGPQHGSTSYSVPLISSIRFSPLYDPNDNLDEAKRGFRFHSVGDMLAMRTLPKIVRALKAHHGGSMENSIALNELLLIKSARNKLTGKQLKVYSLTSNKKKCLNENCMGEFSTSPDSLCMYLYEVTMNLADALPYKALVSLANPEDSVLTDLHGAVVMMRKTATETSVIATSALSDESDEQPEVAEMPINLDIEVEAVSLEERDLEHLRLDTRLMYDNFDPFTVCLYITKATRRMYDIQCLLYTKLVHGNGFKGLEIIRPNSITNTTSKRPTNISVHPTINSHSSSSSTTSSTTSNTTTTSFTRSQSTQGITSGDSLTSAGYQSLSTSPSSRPLAHTDYYVVMSPGATKRTISQDDTSDHSGDSVLSHHEHLGLLEAHNQRLESRVNQNTEKLQKLTNLVEHILRRVDSLSNQIRMMSFDDLHDKIPTKSLNCSPSNSPPVSVDNRPQAPLPIGATRHIPCNGSSVGGTYNLIDGSMEGVSPPMNGSSHPGGVYSSAEDEETSEMSNAKFLTTISHRQVLCILDAMGLQQYRDHFKVEQISGEILSECDEDMLAHDLRISSKLHRMRLLKVISGRHSARNILNGEDPYIDRKSQANIIEKTH